MSELVARLDDWCLVFVGNPIDCHVLIGRVSGHDRLTDGNVASTSPVRFLSEDLSYAFTQSQGRRYDLGAPSPLTLKDMCVLASTLAWSWGLPGETKLRFEIEPRAIAGRHLIDCDG